MKKITKLSIFLVAVLAVFSTASFVSAQYYTGLCTDYSYQQCSGNYLYWYDSCGNQRNLIQYCQNGCSNGICADYNDYNYNNNYYSTCNDHAYRDCVGTAIYWYNSCSNQQDLYQNCADSNLTCQYGQCVSQKSNYSAHYQKACYGDNLYWYDSLGVINNVYQNCADSNSCTLDNCKSAKCSNVSICDGSTCATGSADYVKYCGSTNCGNGTCEEKLGETESTCSSDCKKNTDNKIDNLSVSFFSKKNSTSLQWDKAVQLGQDETVYFLITLNNNSDVQVDNVIVSVNIPSEISYLGNLKIDDVALSGDIVSGINVGSVQAMGKKSITFEGKTQTFSIQEQKQAIASINSVEAVQSDSISISFDASQSSSASISSAPVSGGFIDFIKRWFMWIIAGFILVCLFIAVFKRISSNV